MSERQYILIKKILSRAKQPLSANQISMRSNGTLTSKEVAQIIKFSNARTGEIEVIECSSILKYRLKPTK